MQQFLPRAATNLYASWGAGFETPLGLTWVGQNLFVLSSEQMLDKPSKLDPLGPASLVRSLASRTQQSTQEIQGLIERLQAGANQAAAAMERGRVPVGTIAPAGWDGLATYLKNAGISPAATESDTPSSTTRPPKRSVRLSTSSSAIPSPRAAILLDVAIAPALRAAGLEYAGIGRA